MRDMQEVIKSDIYQALKDIEQAELDENADLISSLRKGLAELEAQLSAEHASWYALKCKESQERIDRQRQLLQQESNSPKRSSAGPRM